MIHLGRWTVTGELGRGGMGVVLRARDAALGRDVAIKLLTGRAGEARERFLREARAAARLRHENIVTVHELAEHDGQDLLVMELVEGEGLDRVLAREGPLAVRRAVEVTRDVARALAHAHAHGVLHRDVKPANVLVERATGRALLVDFGVARERDAARLTRTGVLVGTPTYMAPEQLGGDRAPDERADVYSLGATLYELLTGEAPFEGETLLELLRRVQREPAAPPSARRREVDPGLDAIVLRCLAKAPDARYASAGALARDLERWLAGEPVGAPPARRRWPLGAAVALGAIAAAPALLAALQAARSEPRPRLDAATFADRLAAAAPPSRPLAGREGAIAALASELQAALEGESSPLAWMRDARARAAALGGLAALASGDVAAARAAAARLESDARGSAEAQALAAALLTHDAEPRDPAGAARALGRAIDGGRDHPELRAWRAALLLAAPDAGPTDAAWAASDLERAARDGRPDLATPSLRALALLRRGRPDEAAAIEGASPDVVAEVAAARALDRLQRGLVDEAQTIVSPLVWSSLPERARRAARALADEALRRAAPPPRLDDASARETARLLALAARVDPERPAPIDLVRRLMEYATAYERATTSLDLALDVAALAPDDPFVQERAVGLETLAHGDDRTRLADVLRRALASSPSDPRLLLTLSDCLLDLWSLDEVAPLLDRLEALELDGEDAATAAFLRGRWLYASGRTREAADLLDSLEERGRAVPRLGDYRMLAHDALGDAELAVRLAADVLRQEALTPTRSFSRERALQVLWRHRGRLDDRAALREAVRRVLVTGPELWGWHVRAAWLAQKDGDAAACAASLRLAREHVGRYDGPEREELERAVGQARHDDPAGLERLVERLDALRGANFEP